MKYRSCEAIHRLAEIELLERWSQQVDGMCQKYGGNEPGGVKKGVFCKMCPGGEPRCRASHCEIVEPDQK